MRFAILRHDHPELHWDLLLEAGATCRTWRLSAPPEYPLEIPALPIADHRNLYLDYEGPVSGDRGAVARWDGGEFVWWTAMPQLVRGFCRGERFVGEVQLVSQDDGATWIARFLP